MTNAKKARTGNANRYAGGRTPVRRSSSVLQLRCERRSRKAPIASRRIGGTQTSGFVQKNSARPCQIGRTSQRTTSATIAAATGAGLMKETRRTSPADSTGYPWRAAP